MPTWSTKLAAIEHARSDYPNAFLLGPAKARRSLLGNLITARPRFQKIPHKECDMDRNARFPRSGDESDQEISFRSFRNVEM
jgi:hypothetical protein